MKFQVKILFLALLYVYDIQFLKLNKKHKILYHPKKKKERTINKINNYLKSLIMTINFNS